MKYVNMATEIIATNTLNNHKLDVVNVNAYVKFDQNPIIHSQDI